MTSRFRSFIRLKNVFNFKNLYYEQQIAPKSNICLFGTKANSKSYTKIAMIIGGLGFGGGVYGYLAAPDRKNRIETVSATGERDYVVRYEIPDIKPSREILGPATELDLELTLYQYQNCPFCCKVRTFLDYYGIPYNIIEVNPVMRQQLKFSEYKKVPILIAKDKKTSVKYQLNDSSVIISILGTLLLDPHNKLEKVLKYYVPYVSTNEKGKKVEEVLNGYFLMFGDGGTKGRTEKAIKQEREWRKWADSFLVHILSPNVYCTYDEALQAFNYFSEVAEWEKNFAAWERLTVIYVGATAMYFIGKRLKKKHGLKDNVRQSLYDACNQWIKAVGSNQKFMGGDIPNLADLAVYGLLNSIEGCIAFRDLLEKTTIGTWYFNVKEAVTNHDGFKQIQ